MTQRAQLKKLADDCRECARIYSERPGLVGHGTNAGTICDLYLTLASVAEAVLDGEPARDTKEG